jgi:hypothetical protein
MVTALQGSEPNAPFGRFRSLRATSVKAARLAQIPFDSAQGKLSLRKNARSG